ncbi:MAG: ribosomal protein S18-alanine N-acetyltransferase [Terracidiphilus sp.]
MSFNAAKIEIRPLDGSDFDAILGIAEILDQAPHWSRQHYEEILRADAPRPRVALVACGPRTAEIAGFAIAALVPPQAELESIAVAANAQRRGIGRRLMAALTADLRRHGIAELQLEVRASNSPALGFYASLGFRETARRPGYYAHPKEDAVLMALELG